jgi:amino acid transporter
MSVTSGGSSGEEAAARGVEEPTDRDIRRLHQLGYAQELLRRMGGFSNFAVSFTIISILSGCLTLYSYGMATGGPVIMNIGWPLVGIFVTLVGLAMAEVASSFPTAGGLYYWAAKLAPGQSGPGWSWMTGWFNLMGQVGITAGIDFGLAFFADALLHVLFGYPTGRGYVMIVYGVVLFLHGLMNTFGIRLVAFLNDVSVWWHIAGVLIIFGVLYFIPAHHAAWGWTFTHFVNKTGFAFSGAPIYVFLIGLLLAQYTFTGYDASAHMSEETRYADTASSWGIVMSIVISLFAGWILLIGVTHAIIPSQYGTDLAAPISGVAPVDIFIRATSRHIGEFLLFIVVGAQFYCGMSSVTANSRMIYAFSRDGAIPGSSFWHRINKRTRTPTNSIWLAAVAAFLLGLPYLWSPTAYAAVTSIAVIGLYIAYAIPVLLRRLQGAGFQRGPWHLGRWSAVIGWIAIVWVVFITILFVLPEAAPVNLHNFNYASVATAVVLFGAGGWYLLSARKWFKGPKVQGTPEELAAIERELGEIAP